MGWLIALGVLVLLAILPLGFTARYNADGAVLKVLAGPVAVQVYPAKKKKDKTKKKPAKEKKKKASGKAGEPAKKKEGGSFTDFLPLVSIALDLLRDCGGKLRVNRLELNLILAGDDPCDLAIQYGKACTAMGCLWPVLEEVFVIKKRDVKIQCDFEADQTLVDTRLDMTITVGRLFALVGVHGFKAIKELIKIMNKRKGGAAT